VALEQPGSPLVPDGGGPVESAAGDEVQVWASGWVLASEWVWVWASGWVLASEWEWVWASGWVLASE
jgi:hypothetical protein